MIEFLKLISDKLSGFYFFVFVSAITIASFFWILLSQKTKDKPLFIKKMLSIGSVFLLAGVISLIHYFIITSTFSFPENVTGILVLQIESDNKNNSLQRDWISTLNNELSKKKTEQNIQVHAYNKKVNEDFGWEKAHQKARKFGEKTEAFLVLWGSRIGEKKIHPRITIVDTNRHDFFINNGLALETQIISETNLPPELIDKPVSLAHFINGYNAYSHSNFPAAINSFEKSIQTSNEDSTLLNDIIFYLASSHLLNSHSKRKTNRNLSKVIQDYSNLTDYYKSVNDTIKYALTNNNLGIAFAALESGDQLQNLNKAANAFEKAAKIFSKKKLVLENAQTANNLVVVSMELSGNGKNPNIKNVINKFEAILQHDVKKNSTRLWALIQYNLGITYLNLPNKILNNINKAIGSFKNSLKYNNKKDFPITFAIISNNLGKAYIALPKSERKKYLDQADELFNEASIIFDKKQYPFYRNIAQNNISDTEKLLSREYEDWIKFCAIKEHSTLEHFIDDYGNIYFTWSEIFNNRGHSMFDDSRIVTVKYAPDGTQLWINYFHSGNDSSISFSPDDISVDSEGNVYIVGEFRSMSYNPSRDEFSFHGDQGIIIKYNKDGKKIIDSYNQNILGFDNVGTDRGFQGSLWLYVSDRDNIFISGRCYPLYPERCMIAKYTKDLKMVWSDSNYEDDLEYGLPNFVEHYASGNTYIANLKKYVKSYNEPYSSSFVFKFNPVGHFQWKVAQFSKQLGNYILVQFIDVDPMGNLIISGATNDDIDDFIIIKFDQAGKKLWERKYAVSNHRNARIIAQVIDGLGNIYIAGTNRPLKPIGNKIISDYLTTKYDKDGNELWTVYYNGAEDSHDVISNIAIDKSGNIYVTGGAWHDYGVDIVTIIYDSTGIIKNKYRYENKKGSLRYPQKLTIDSLNNIYLTAEYYPFKGKSGYVRIKYKGIQEN